MDNFILLSDAKFQGELICNWNFIDNEDWRIYYTKYDHNHCNKDCIGRHGFKFCSVLWICKDEYLEISFNGIAYFDGVRHMWLGTEQNEIFGYINYPNIKDLIEILQEIKKLEILFCMDI